MSENTEKRSNDGQYASTGFWRRKRGGKRRSFRDRMRGIGSRMRGLGRKIRNGTKRVKDVAKGVGKFAVERGYELAIDAAIMAVAGRGGAKLAKSLRKRAAATGAGLSRRGRSIRSRNCRPCLLYTSPSPRDATLSRMPSSA